MMWRAILVWLFSLCAAFADSPWRSFVTSVSFCEEPSSSCWSAAEHGTATNGYGLTTNTSFTANLPSSVTFSYDANGNLTNDGLRTFQYDAENQLTNVSIAGQWQVGFVYDALNRRRIEQDFTWTGSAWSKTNEVHFLYDGTVPIQELNSTNGLLVTYTRGLDLSLSLDGAGGIGGLLARSDSNGTAFYHSDLNGNVTTLIDQNQHIVARYEYDPYGKLLGQWGSYATANRYLFSSKERILPANLYYYGARFYDPNLQRWLSCDPEGENGGLNLYTSFFNDPVGIIDRNGDDNLWNIGAGNNAPPSLTMVVPAAGGPPSVSYQGGDSGDPLLLATGAMVAGGVASGAYLAGDELAGLASAISGLFKKPEADEPGPSVKCPTKQDLNNRFHSHPTG